MTKKNRLRRAWQRNYEFYAVKGIYFLMNCPIKKALTPRQLSKYLKYEQPRLRTEEARVLGKFLRLGGGEEEISGKQIFDYAFDRAYALGKQEKDAEEEEVLTVSRDVVRMLYDRNDSVKVRQTLESLFGSKCLPDENSSNLEKLEKNDEPKFKLGDKVKDISSPHDGGIYTVDDIKQSSDGFIYHIQGLIGKSNVKESALEPYSQPATYDFKVGDKVRYKEVYTIEEIEKDGIALVDSDFLVDPEDLVLYEEAKENVNLSQETANCDKGFDNILKDSFSKERRLNIATQIMGHIIQNGFYSLAEKYREENINNIVKLSMQITDTLIAEAEKGGKK